MSFIASYIHRFTETAQIFRKTLGAAIGEVGGKLYLDLDGGGATLFADEAIHTAVNVGAKNGSTVSVVEYGFGGFLHKTVLTLAATPITVADATAGGGVKLYTFPEGVITIQAGSFNVVPTVTSVLASTLHASTTIDCGVGSASAGAGALTTTEDDIIDSANATSSATINVAGAAAKAVRTTAPVNLDGSSAAKTANFNIGVATATDIDADATIVLTGTVTILWLFGGDI